MVIADLTLAAVRLLFLGSDRGYNKIDKRQGRIKTERGQRRKLSTSQRSTLNEGSHARICDEALAEHGGVHGREHAGANALLAGRPLLGGTPRKRGDRGGRCSRQPDDDRPGAYTNAGRGNNNAHLARGRKKISRAPSSSSISRSSCRFWWRWPSVLLDFCYAVCTRIR